MLARGSGPSHIAVMARVSTTVLLAALVPLLPTLNGARAQGSAPSVTVPRVVVPPVVIPPVVVPLPAVPRPPSSTDALRGQQQSLQQLLEDQQRRQSRDFEGVQDAERRRRDDERERRRRMPVTPYDRPVGAPAP